jgi:hypothetical protein
MKYRIQVLVSAERLSTVVEALFGGDLDYDPELKVWPASQPKERIERPTGTWRERQHAEVEASTRVERPIKQLPIALGKRSGNNKGNKRQELVEAALKTGPKRWGELKAALSAGGLSENSLNSLAATWQKAGKIVRSQDGLWSLNDGPTQRTNAG